MQAERRTVSPWNDRFDLEYLETGSDKRSGITLPRESRAKIWRIRSPDPFGEVSPYFVANTQVYEDRWENAKEQQIRTSVYPVGDGLLPVRGGRIPVRDARYHNGVFQPRGHINHLLVYHRRHGAAYLCNQKKNG